MALTHTDVRRILDILDQAPQLESLEISVGDLVLRAYKPGAAVSLEPLAPLVTPNVTAKPAAVAAPQAARGAAVQVPEGMIAVRSPMVGTFYRRPKPEDPPFVEEGARIDQGGALCILEAMKLFNTVSAPVAGRIVKIAAENGEVVQRDAVLMIIEPDVRA
jgi:acetyl-CoA carboxylase biotin carboxyl carrier protein